MASVILNGDTSGSVTLSAPAVAGSTTQTLVNVTGTLAPLVSGTAVTATGTSIDFTGIPSWVKRITVMFSGVSTNGASFPIVQLGSTTFTTSGYASSGGNRAAETTPTTGLIAVYANATVGSYAWSGQIIITNITSNTWVSSFVMGSGTYVPCWGAGTSPNLSGVLDRIRITTVNGTDTFDAGSVNIMYE